MKGGLKLGIHDRRHSPAVGPDQGWERVPDPVAAVQRSGWADRSDHPPPCRCERVSRTVGMRGKAGHATPDEAGHAAPAGTTSTMGFMSMLARRGRISRHWDAPALPGGSGTHSAECCCAGLSSRWQARTRWQPGKSHRPFATSSFSVVRLSARPYAAPVGPAAPARGDTASPIPADRRRQQPVGPPSEIAVRGSRAGAAIWGAPPLSPVVSERLTSPRWRTPSSAARHGGAKQSAYLNGVSRTRDDAVTPATQCCCWHDRNRRS
jgi:hypothetical protein